MADGMRNRINGSHSRLLERSLQHIFPAESFPFAVRLSIDLLAAAGSEHMMALSAASLAMTDAGIPLRSQIAGAQDRKHSDCLLSCSCCVAESFLLLVAFVHILEFCMTQTWASTVALNSVDLVLAQCVLVTGDLVPAQQLLFALAVSDCFQSCRFAETSGLLYAVAVSACLRSYQFTETSGLLFTLAVSACLQSCHFAEKSGRMQAHK